MNIVGHLDRTWCLFWFALGVVLIALSSSAWAQIKAFPQAEGFGAAALGGRGGDVYHVTNLNDSGAGSLRFGIDNAPSSGRTIVFDVGGWITINSKLGINSDKRRITIAGQTAPGGIGIRGNQFSVGGDDVVIRQMQFRPGKGAGRVDSAGANADAQRVIYDHISAGFSYDENFSVAATDFTLQYSSVNYGLEDHSAGSLIEQARRLSFHHNLYAHNNTRNPKARVNEGIDWINNVVYDYNNGFIAGDSDTTDYFWTANVDGNYFITGPGDTGRPMIILGRSWNYGLYFGTNAYDNDGDANHDGVLYTGNGSNGNGLSGVVSGTYTWASTPYATPAIWKDASAQAAYERVLSEFGPTPWARSEVDQLLYNNVVNRTGSIISHENQLVPLGISNGGFGTLGGGVKPLDTDNDGIPDAWELKHGTNPSVASNNGDLDFDGYTDLEEYLNDLAAFKAIGPIVFSGIGRYADWRRWTNRWEPSRIDDVHINDGAAFVDAVGQKAGTLRVAQGGRLYVTSGWLEVTDDLVVGGSGSGSVRQYGGEIRVLGGEVDIQDGDYQLREGALTTPLVTKSANGTFVFTGGLLDAGTVAFDLVNQGGAIEPGRDIVGVASVLGNLTVESGSLQIDLGGVGVADLLSVSGSVALGGDLEVSLLGGFVPSAGQSWQIITAAEILGGFNSVTPGFTIQQQGNSLWLLAGSGVGSFVVPEPGSLMLLMAAAALLVTGRRLLRPAIFALACVLVLYGGSAEAVVVKTIADAQLSENGTTGIGDATDAGNGTGPSINARWTFTGATPNRNEWVALKFDLSAYSNKAEIANVALRNTMFRTNTNNAKNLHLYALKPGTAGENWDEASITYGSMPGFTFDGNSNTNILSVGGSNPLHDLGTFAVSGVPNEGNISTINPASLTSFIQGMGSHNLLTILFTTQDSTTGQWRIASREATVTETGVLNGMAGDFASFLQFDIVHQTSGVQGDYNDNGVVDAADYTVWRNGGPLINEEVSPNVVDIADYLFWKERYGATTPGGSGAASAALVNSVPEPGTFSLLLVLSVLTLGAARTAR